VALISSELAAERFGISAQTKVGSTRAAFHPHQVSHLCKRRDAWLGDSGAFGRWRWVGGCGGKFGLAAIASRRMGRWGV